MTKSDRMSPSLAWQVMFFVSFSTLLQNAKKGLCGTQSLYFLTVSDFWPDPAFAKNLMVTALNGYSVRLTRISTRVYCCLAIAFQNPG